MCACHVGGDSKDLQPSGRTAGDDDKLYDSSSAGAPQLLADSNKLELSIPIGTAATGGSSI